MGGSHGPGGTGFDLSIKPDLLKHVTYSKYLMGRAYDLWRQGGDLNAAQAVLFAHDSAEILMRVIADHKHVRLPDGFMPKPSKR